MSEVLRVSFHRAPCFRIVFRTPIHPSVSLKGGDERLGEADRVDLSLSDGFGRPNEAEQARAAMPSYSAKPAQVRTTNSNAPPKASGPNQRSRLPDPGLSGPEWVFQRN